MRHEATKTKHAGAKKEMADKAEPFKRWLAKVDYKRVQEIEYPGGCLEYRLQKLEIVKDL